MMWYNKNMKRIKIYKIFSVFLTTYSLSINSFAFDGIAKRITPEEEAQIREMVGKEVGESLAGPLAENQSAYNFFKDGKFTQKQYNSRYMVERDSNTITEVSLNRFSQVEISTCYDNELIFTVHPEHYEDVSIQMEKLSRPDNFTFDPIMDGQGRMKGGALRTKAFDLTENQRVETQLSFQIEETKEWYNVIVHAEKCPDGRLDYLRVVYFKPDSSQITERTSLLTPQDKFIELTYPFEEASESQDFKAEIGDIIASPNSDWVILSVYILLQKNRYDPVTEKMLSDCLKTANDCTREMELDQESRVFEAEFRALHSNKINEITVKTTPLQLQTEAMSKKTNQHVARFNIHLNVDYRYTQTNQFTYLFVKDVKDKKYQILKLNLKNFIDDLKRRGSKF